MKRPCPNKNCKDHKSLNPVIKVGCFLRKDDSKKVQRFLCKTCKKTFSHATFNPAFAHKKRRINPFVFKFLCSGVSQRRLALNLSVTRTTIRRKLLFWTELARKEQKKLLQNFDRSICFVQIDDLITIEHTKLKPLSVSIAIRPEDRAILGAVVSQIPAFGHLAVISKRKYGNRKNELPEGLNQLMELIKPAINNTAHFESDEHKLYPGIIKQHFPATTHQSYASERGCVSGQGELKKVKFDPLFSINHTCAMFRANINRLFRRTWCTTKRAEMLQKHLDIYVYFHNTQLI